MKILALDPACSTGYAYRQDGVIRFGSWDCSLDGRHQNVSTTMLKIRLKLESFFVKNPDLKIIVFENVVSVKQAYVAHIYGAITGEILKFCDEHKIASDSVSPPGWKSTIGLKGRDVMKGKDIYVPYIMEKFGINRNNVYKKSGVLVEGAEDALAAVGILTWAEAAYPSKG